MRGRVGDDPATALREHLIDTAEQLIAVTPITSITTREIARTAGVSDGVLYNYFEDKNELLVEALLRKYRVLVEEFTARMPEPGVATISDNLNCLADALYDLTRQFVPVVAGLITDPLLFHKFFATLHAQPNGPDQLRQPLLDYLDGERRLGRIPADADIDAITLLLLGPTAMLALGSHFGPPDMEKRSAVVRPVVEALIRGLGPNS